MPNNYVDRKSDQGESSECQGLKNLIHQNCQLILHLRYCLSIMIVMIFSTFSVEIDTDKRKTEKLKSTNHIISC